ncbi:MAG: hypothetical protein EOM73_17750 [Bacteroidia bacterium]|nr:hypothetical protein [Bacteroidia bacterium]
MLPLLPPMPLLYTAMHLLCICYAFAMHLLCTSIYTPLLSFLSSLCLFSFFSFFFSFFWFFSFFFSFSSFLTDYIIAVFDCPKIPNHSIFQILFSGVFAISATHRCRHWICG